MNYKFCPYSDYTEFSVDEMENKANAFYETMRYRRSVRHFSTRKVPRSIIEKCLRSAGSGPSGANKQPWHFVVVEDQRIKANIRQAAEVEEHEFYEHRAPKEWLDALAPLGTDENKVFLEEAPYLIAIFAKNYDLLPGGQKTKNYYASESVGIATGILIAAIHHAGLVSLTHTPSPMKFLNRILKRPGNERPYLLLVVGYPAAEATVPMIRKKELHEIVTFI